MVAQAGTICSGASLPSGYSLVGTGIREEQIQVLAEHLVFPIGIHSGLERVEPRRIDGTLP